ncbi:MAG: hypothetical protein LBN42_03475 [Oscillospiraceae bacterium]|jgi:hypothetical protein|nr:hypothetical protein [Oscillospiraceae bacterium]
MNRTTHKFAVLLGAFFLTACCIFLTACGKSPEQPVPLDTGWHTLADRNGNNAEYADYTGINIIPLTEQIAQIAQIEQPETMFDTDTYIEYSDDTAEIPDIQNTTAKQAISEQIHVITTTPTQPTATTPKTTTTTAKPPPPKIVRADYTEVADIADGRKQYDKAAPKNYITTAAITALNNNTKIAYVSAASKTKTYHFDRNCSNMTAVIACTVAEAEAIGAAKCKKE